MARAGPSTVAWSATRPGWTCRSSSRERSPSPGEGIRLSTPPGASGANQQRVWQLGEEPVGGGGAAPVVRAGEEVVPGAGGEVDRAGDPMAAGEAGDDHGQAVVAAGEGDQGVGGVEGAVAGEQVGVVAAQAQGGPGDPELEAVVAGEGDGAAVVGVDQGQLLGLGALVGVGHARAGQAEQGQAGRLDAAGGGDLGD